MPATFRLPAFAALSLLTVAVGACRTVDYAYRHEVSGRVLNAANGIPVAGVTVERLEAGMTNTPVRDIYRRLTAADGTFSFLYSGLGPRPAAAQEWVLSLRKPGYVTSLVTNRVPWTPFTEGRSNFGYVLGALDLRLDPSTR